jgi:hypothetical protein
MEPRENVVVGRASDRPVRRFHCAIFVSILWVLLSSVSLAREEPPLSPDCSSGPAHAR